jgi:hypothetical protein
MMGENFMISGRVPRIIETFNMIHPFFLNFEAESFMPTFQFQVYSHIFPVFQELLLARNRFLLANT